MTEAAAKLAWHCTLEFLNKYLRSSAHERFFSAQLGARHLRCREWREGTEAIFEILFLGAEFHLVLLYRRSTGEIAIIKTDLSVVYRDYIACLNKQNWSKLEQFVHDEVYRLGY